MKHRATNPRSSAASRRYDALRRRSHASPEVLVRMVGPRPSGQYHRGSSRASQPIPADYTSEDLHRELYGTDQHPMDPSHWRWGQRGAQWPWPQTAFPTQTGTQPDLLRLRPSMQFDHRSPVNAPAPEVGGNFLSAQRLRQKNPQHEAQPATCCYDVAAGRLRCEDADRSVSLLGMQHQTNGPIMALVEGADGSGIQTFPVCDDAVHGCCYDPTTESLVCDQDPELHGREAGIIAAWVGPDGQIHVWAAWEGGGARMPLCPGTTECPPVFCCVNIQSMTYVCPGRPELNGQPADVIDIVTEGEHAWAVLDDDTRVPLCGQKCPAPSLEPEASNATPGQWMSRQEWRATVDPASSCGCPAKKGDKPCCDACAHGNPCDATPQASTVRRKIRFGNKDAYRR